MKLKIKTIQLLCLFLLINVDFVFAQSGHYSPASEQIRDYVVSPAGFYGFIYNYWYTSRRYNNNEGVKVSSIIIGPGGGDTMSVNENFKSYSISPDFCWVTKLNSAGVKFGASISPTLASAHAGAALTTISEKGLWFNESQFAMGDLYVEPVLFGLTKKHWDFALSYSFYAPTGKYNIDSVTLPHSGVIKITAPDNIGLGYWTNQFQGAVSWYPWPDQRMAVATAFTYEINGNQKGFDLTPGQNFSFNWGISEYLPLDKKQSWQLTLGITGYGSWQVSRDKGSDATNTDQFKRVAGIGAQLGLIYQPIALSLSIHGFNQFNALNLFEGQSYGLVIGKTF